MAAPRLTDRQRDEIAQRYAGGESTRALSERFGVSQSYPGKLAKRNGVRLRLDYLCRARMSAAAQARLA